MDTRDKQAHRTYYERFPTIRLFNKPYTLDATKRRSSTSHIRWTLQSDAVQGKLLAGLSSSRSGLYSFCRYASTELISQTFEEPCLLTVILGNREQFVTGSLSSGDLGCIRSVDTHRQN